MFTNDKKPEENTARVIEALSKRHACTVSGARWCGTATGVPATAGLIGSITAAIINILTFGLFAMAMTTVAVDISEAISVGPSADERTKRNEEA